MEQLEYRLFDEQKNFPALYHFKSIDKEEVMVRFLADYLVKDGVVYEKTSNAIEVPLYIIYVKLSEDEKPLLNNRLSKVATGYIVLEIREFIEYASEYPVITNLEFTSLSDLALLAQCNYLTLGGVEWEKTSFEVDEDRQRYVLYAIKTR
ncbi:hypothetical protein [Desulfosporosinus lacus]|uniref:Uncharacterized protein n=1 Tax=Desulfosporosinus lacus DSM 15449 TaxID=1121420 RepID=A0A1M6AIR4_9FIRM|nr:hypothetical protein [Desulfosporosinus lacus]SHI36372.1 hypothetical protein SAMN02746098_03961 [Desulfosporosinus lacus DSM 15449]